MVYGFAHQTWNYPIWVFLITYAGNGSENASMMGSWVERLRGIFIVGRDEWGRKGEFTHKFTTHACDSGNKKRKPTNRE
jgi:hypothetical protein